MTPALLALEDGTVLAGESVGVEGYRAGEVVFNTSHTGYQEILTDPSYCRQIVTLTYPHIGNTGTNAEDEQSGAVHASGMVVRDVPLRPSSWRATHDLKRYLQERDVVGLAGIDTRRLTRILREKGAQRGCIAAGSSISAQKALELAKAFEGLKGLDLAKVVSLREPIRWTQSTWRMGHGFGEGDQRSFKVVAYDFGAKREILRIMAGLGLEIDVVPAKTPASEVMAREPDGVFLSNGPGDPEPCNYAIESIRSLIGSGIPIFGICLGHQLLALASGARTQKMKFGHHGANHPVKDLVTGKVMITSQNHGFCVSEDGLPSFVEVTHRSLFDGTIQGIRRTDVPAFGFQGHPEASPGPNDALPLFQQFLVLMERRAHGSLTPKF